MNAAAGDRADALPPHGRRHGYVLVDKPAGPSSAAAVSVVKKALGADRAGHCGTLDPAASGLLVVVVGGATRLAGLIQGGKKSYTGTVLLGVTSDTDDAAGTLSPGPGPVPAAALVREAAVRSVGTFPQAPPAVSAVKIRGERSYRRVRRGESVSPAPRDVTLYSVELDEPAADGSVRFSLECSKGFYVRSFARDLGAALGCGGCLGSLRRTASAPFSVADAAPLGSPSGFVVRPWEDLTAHLPVVDLTPEEVEAAASGDERVVTALVRREPIMAAGCGPVVYRDGATGRRVGLFIDRDGRRRFGPSPGRKVFEGENAYHRDEYGELGRHAHEEP